MVASEGRLRPRLRGRTKSALILSNRFLRTLTSSSIKVNVKEPVEAGGTLGAGDGGTVVSGVLGAGVGVRGSTGTSNRSPSESGYVET